MTPKNIDLPHDILETVVDCVYINEDTEALRSLALVSKSLLIPAQKYIFRRITLNPEPQKEDEYDPNLTPGVVMRLKEVLSGHPRLISYIQVIQLVQRSISLVDLSQPGQTIDGPDGPMHIPLVIRYMTDWITDRGDALAEVLELIISESRSDQPQIRQLTIESSKRDLADLATWQSFHPNLQKALRRIFTQPSLEVVVIHYVSGLPRDLFRLDKDGRDGGGLKQLRLIASSFVPGSTEMNSQDAQDGGPHDLRINTPTAAAFCRIKSLSIMPFLDPNGVSLDLQIALRAHEFGLTLDYLEELSLRLPTLAVIHTVSEGIFNREEGLPRLKKVDIDFSVGFDRNVSFDPTWDFSSFASISQFPRLEEITFTGGPSRIENGRLTFDWMNGVIPSLEAYTSLYRTAIANPDSHSPLVPLAKVTFDIFLPPHKPTRPYDDILQTVSSLLHKLYIVYTSCQLQRSQNVAAASSQLDSTSKSRLQFRLELSYMSGDNVSIHDLEGIATRWREIFQWEGEEIGQHPLGVEIVKWNPAPISSAPRSYF